MLCVKNVVLVILSGVVMSVVMVLVSGWLLIVLISVLIMLVVSE